MHSHTFAWFHDLLYPQEAQLSPRSRAMLHVIEYFAKSLKITQGRWKWYYLKVWIRFSIFSFHNNYGRILSRFDTTHDRDGHSGNQPPQDGEAALWHRAATTFPIPSIICQILHRSCPKQGIMWDLLSPSRQLSICLNYWFVPVHLSRMSQKVANAFLWNFRVE